MLASILPVLGLVRKDPPDAASRVRHVAFVAGDYVDVQMQDRLPRSQAVEFNVSVSSEGRNR